MKMVFREALYLITLVALSLGLIIQDSLADSIDEQVREISNLLMCPVCQGQSVAESNSQLAKDMRKVIRKKLEEGKSKEEIIAYFVDRYGETILGAPPPKGANWLLWILPALALVAGGLGIAIFLHKSKEKREKPEEESIEVSTQVEPEYLEKIKKDLREFDS
jgi:cytochrome c-type biogenesis protein CcmH